MEPFALLADRLEDYVHMRMRFIGMKCERVPMPRRAKYSLCKIAHGEQKSVGRGSRRH
jgi:hypothetical protein